VLKIMNNEWVEHWCARLSVIALVTILIMFECLHIIQVEVHLM